MGEDPAVAIVVLTNNQKDLTLDCLQSLGEMDYGAFRIICVDNGSEDGTSEAVAARFPDTEVVRLAENKGFTGGCNEGIRAARRVPADYLLFLNNDTVVARDLLAEMVRAAERDERIGIVGASIYFFEPSDAVWFAGGKLHWWKGFAGHLTAVPEDMEETDYASGCCLLIRKACLEAVGPMDEALFLYCDDVDWAMKARGKGFKVVIAPRARLWHKVNAWTGGEHDALFVYYWTRAWLQMLRRHSRGLTRTARTAVFLSLNRPRLFARLVAGGNRGAARALILAVGDFYRGRMGRTVVRNPNGKGIKRVK